MNYDIPFNPNKLEQRIGRIDRYGQRHDPEVYHFVGSGFGQAVDTYEADLEFLARVAQKVARMEADLGAVNAVLADAVQRRMLGQQVDIDREIAAQPGNRPKGRVAADTNIRDQVHRLHEQLQSSVDTLHLTPEALKRVVDTALELSHQQPLRAVPGTANVWEVPSFTGTWESTTRDLPHPLRPEQRRPVTFDPQVAHGRREDVVFAHLGHPLVARATRLLRAAVTSTDIDLHRVTAVISDDPELQEPLAVSYARFVVVGGDGVRLHEEVLHAGGWVRRDGRFARVESFARLDTQLTVALSRGDPAPPQWSTGSRKDGQTPRTGCSSRWNAAPGNGRPRCGTSWSGGRRMNAAGSPRTWTGSAPRCAAGWPPRTTRTPSWPCSPPRSPTRWSPPNSAAINSPGGAGWTPCPQSWTPSCAASPPGTPTPPTTCSRWPRCS